MKETDIDDNWICYVAAPDYARQNHILCIGTSASGVYESASQRGYKRPVIYSTSFKSIKKIHNVAKQKDKVKFDPFLLPQIPRKVLEELLEK